MDGVNITRLEIMEIHVCAEYTSFLPHASVTTEASTDKERSVDSFVIRCRSSTNSI